MVEEARTARIDLVARGPAWVESGVGLCACASAGAKKRASAARSRGVIIFGSGTVKGSVSLPTSIKTAVIPEAFGEVPGFAKALQIGRPPLFTVNECR